MNQLLFDVVQDIVRAEFGEMLWIDGIWSETARDGPCFVRVEDEPIV
jgi:hypothetical protein